MTSDVYSLVAFEIKLIGSMKRVFLVAGTIPGRKVDIFDRVMVALIKPLKID